MNRLTAAQQRFIDNATLIAATRLIFDRLAKHHKPKQLSDVVTIFNGQALKKSERQEDGDFDVYGSGGLVGRYSKCLSDNPFVVIGRKGSAGKPTYAPAGGWVIDTAYYAQPNSIDSINTKYLYYALSSLDFSDDIITTAIPGINRTAIYKHLIPVPPVDIQIVVCDYLDAVKSKTPLSGLPNEWLDVHRIIERIEALAVRVTEAQSLRREATEDLSYYRTSILKNAFEGRLVNADLQNDAHFEAEISLLSRISNERKNLSKNGKSEIHPLPDPKSLPGIPDSWLWVTLDHVCSRITDGFHNTPTPTETGFPYVLATHIKSEGIDFANCYYVSEEDHKELFAKTQVKRGDILVVNIGAGSGTPAIVNVDFEFSFKNVAILKRISLVDEKFLYYYLIYKRDELIKEVSKGGAQPFLSLKSLRTLPLPLPPLSEQHRIVNCLEHIFMQANKVSQLQTETQRELNALIPSILDKAFKGEL